MAYFKRAEFWHRTGYCQITEIHNSTTPVGLHRGLADLCGTSSATRRNTTSATTYVPESNPVKKSFHTFLARFLRVATRSGRGSVATRGSSSINRQTMSTFGLPSGDGFRGKTSGTYRCHDGRYHSFHSSAFIRTRRISGYSGFFRLGGGPSILSLSRIVGSSE